MGKVFAEIHIYPESATTDLEKLQTQIRQSMPPSAAFQETKLAPIAFGVKKVILTVIISDAEGGTQLGEDCLRVGRSRGRCLNMKTPNLNHGSRAQIS